MTIATRRHAVRRFTTVWSDRFDRHERTFDRLATLTAGVIIGALVVTAMVVGRLYQQGIV